MAAPFDLLFGSEVIFGNDVRDTDASVGNKHASACSVIWQPWQRWGWNHPASSPSR
jgi:hypothetical protein